jgi:putative toxin-antitoxin system antitoxin component (TIGR02293 family)
MDSFLPLDILGVSGSNDSIRQPAEVIRQGLPIAAIKKVATYCNLTNAQLSKVIGTSERTIVRLQKDHKPLNPTWSDRLYRLARIAAQAETVLESQQAAASWLNRPNRALEGHPPIDLLDTDAGTEQVMELLDRTEYGVYS